MLGPGCVEAIDILDLKFDLLLYEMRYNTLIDPMDSKKYGFGNKKILIRTKLKMKI